MNTKAPDMRTVAADDFQTKEKRRRLVGKRLMESLEKTSEEALSRPTPTREEMKELLECNDEEIDNIFGADFKFNL